MLFPNPRIETLCGTSGGEEKSEAEWRAGLRRMAQNQRRWSNFLISVDRNPLKSLDSQK